MKTLRNRALQILMATVIESASSTTKVVSICVLPAMEQASVKITLIFGVLSRIDDFDY